MSIDTRVNQDEGQFVTQEAATAPPAQITVTQILDDLENGRDRKAIKAKYGLTAEEVKMIFEHPKLKGVRVKKARVVRFTLVDDTPTESNQITLGDVIEEISTETAEIVDVQSFPNSGGWDNQTRVEEGLDHKGNYSNNQTEIQD
jgi:hypothetical protein